MRFLLSFDLIDAVSLTLFRLCEDVDVSTVILDLIESASWFDLSCSDHAFVPAVAAALETLFFSDRCFSAAAVAPEGPRGICFTRFFLWEASSFLFPALVSMLLTPNNPSLSFLEVPGACG